MQSDPGKKIFSYKGTPHVRKAPLQKPQTLFKGGRGGGGGGGGGGGRAGAEHMKA